MRNDTRERLDTLTRWLDERISQAEPGEHLPTVREMMRRFSTAQRMVERALKPHLAAGRLKARPGAGIVVCDPEAESDSQSWEGDLLVLYRISDSRLARNLLQEVEVRLKRKGISILQIGYSTEEQALSVLSKMGRFKTCLLQIHFEVLSIEFLAALRKHVESVVIDGVSATGIDADSIGTNWREALAMAYRTLNDKGHDRIAFLTSAHRARQIAMARREYLVLCESHGASGGRWLIELDKLPGSYQIADIRDALARHLDEDGNLPFTALVVWGVTEGFMLERALSELGVIDDLSVVLLGTIDFPSEHLKRFDVVGNSNHEKFAVFETILSDRIAMRERPPESHYFHISHASHGSILPPGD
ncbi:hypothetical protein [Nitratireductor thuwali]|uniref:GntR family transcriptional regulator n=1 Tax=Nitratireductor thuwali TaxID=2267699 RepID=A0ABY5MCZ4_9HYPH|nr:hypothetical protein NTH_00375 [Nitratireductor thuwali]